MLGVLDQKAISLNVVTVYLEMCPQPVQLNFLMLPCYVQQVVAKKQVEVHKIQHINPTECSDDEVMCSDGRVDGHLSPCISTEKRCDGVIDCIGGEDELDHNCPCGPEGAVRLVDGIVPQQGRVEFCRSKRWVKVCFWTPNSAPVVCRQLGFPTAGVYNKIYVDY